MGIFLELHDKPFFESAWEQEQLERNLKGLIQQGAVQSVPVGSTVGYGEQWFEEKKTGEIYRYVPPDFPAKGVWERVNR